MRMLVMTGLFVLAQPVTAAAQQMHVLLISGLGGEPAYTQAFAAQARGLHRVATDTWQVADSSLIWLAEDVALDPQRVRARSTREEVERAFITLAGRAAPGDIVMVVLIGHGSGEGAQARVNLPGADPTAADYNTWLSAFSQQSVVFVNTASASGDFTGVLAAPSRVIITATRTALERNETTFATHFLRGVESGEADADKDGRTTALEAFDFARREVVRSYEADNKLLTERAQLTDTTLASTIVLGSRHTAADPRIATLVAERRALEEQVATLRTKRDSMTAEAYEAELERLILAIAERTRAIRAAGGGS
jgi:hypothetical protein